MQGAGRWCEDKNRMKEGMKGMANIEMKDLKKLFNKKVLRGENFFIGDGTLAFKNYFISLNSIAVVTLNQVQDMSLGRYVIGLVVCALLFFIVPLIAIKVISAVAIVFCAVMVYSIWSKNKNKIYTLQIDLINGSHYMYLHNNKEFICQVADLIRMCIDDKGKTFTIVSNENRIENFIDQSVTGDNNMYMGKAKNIASGNSVINDFGKKNKFKDNMLLNENTSNQTVIKESEWEILEEFLAEQQVRMYGTENEDKCREFLYDVGQRDVKSLKDKLKKMGQKGIAEMFFEGVEKVAQVAIKAILAKVLATP